MLRNLLILFFFFSSFLFANSTITINNTNSFYNNFNFSYLKDELSTLQIDDISKKKFDKNSKNKFTLGYTKGSVWIKFSIDNKSLNNNFILSLNESFYEIANLYYYEDKWIKKSNGVFKPIENREIRSNFLSYDIKLLENEKKVFYLELKGKYAYFGNLTLYEKDYFYFTNVMNINNLYIFIFGIILLIIIFNLFLYLKLREKIYIYYVGYSFFNLIYMINASGILVYVNLQKYMYDLLLCASFMIGFLVLFSCEYLDTKTYLKKYHKALTFVSIPFFILGILVLTSYQPWNKFINNLAGLACILLIVVSIIIYFKGNHKSKYYIFAMILYFSFVVLFTFTVAGAFEYTNITRYGFLVASAIEVTIFSLMLANRYNDRKEEIQLYLEKEVELRTNSLSISNTKLSSLIKERELLLKEVYHRVKNNFHMIIGMLWFENKKNNNNELDELINRIKSMSLVHEYLYRIDDFTNVNIYEYLNKIVNNIRMGYKDVIFDSSIDDIKIEFDSAMSLGVIINEAVTNSMKHNKDTKDFKIEMTLKKEEDNICLILEDNGKGFDINNSNEGLGLKLIKQFSKKLPNSEFKYSFENGVKFQLLFQENQIKKDIIE